MPWPAFNELGDLPIGIYRATLAEVIAHFGHGTAQRVIITARLERIYEMEDLIIGWQTHRDLQRRGIVEVVEHDSE